MVGGFPPPADKSSLGLFVGLNGLEGKWSIPSQLRKQVVSDDALSRITVDGAIPLLAAIGGVRLCQVGV